MEATCRQCGTQFEAQRENATLCGPKCRQRASRAARNGPPAPVSRLAPVAPLVTAPPGEWPLVVATRAELDKAGVLDTALGQLALQLAEKVCVGNDTGSAKAAASKEFRAVRAEVLADVATQADSLDELATRRLKRASGG